MLRRLTVENYALIDALVLELDTQLNIITGETGAGKSILLGALGLLLGAKNDGGATRDNERSCRIEGVFDLSGLGLEGFFEENDLDWSTETTLTRIITPAGKSRAFVNDLPVQLQVLRELGERLVDIHSQHQNLILSSEDFRISTLDTMAGSGEELSRYSLCYKRMLELRKRLSALREAAASGRRDEDWLRYQCDELTAAALRSGEQAEVEAELSMLEHADRISEGYIHLRNALDTDETGVLSLLRNSEIELSRLTSVFPAAGDYAERLHAVIEELKDIDASVTAESQRIESDPERLQKLSGRLDMLIGLQQKHRVADEEALIALRDDYAERLAAIVHNDEAVAEAEQALAEAEQACRQAAEALHAVRAAKAPEFAAGVQDILFKLGMPDAVFQVAVEDTATPESNGSDRVCYLFTANRNREPQAVERIASGGELSRIMLAIKALLAERRQLPTILFDEIDTGVSGRIADAMGEIMARLATKMQVVDITHLPQVASKGSAHFVVCKPDGHTQIRRLNEEERVTEIAKMLSGSEITEAALIQARILLGA